MRVISYNLRKHKASGELLALARNFAIDALCLQEVDSAELPDTLGPLRPRGYHQGQPPGTGHLLPHRPVHRRGHTILCVEEISP